MDEVDVVHAFPFSAQNVSRLERHELESRRQPVEVPLPESLEKGHGPEEALCTPDPPHGLGDFGQPRIGTIGVFFHDKYVILRRAGGAGDGGRGKGDGGQKKSGAESESSSKRG